MPKNQKTKKTKFKFICPLFNDEVFLFLGDKSEAEKFCDSLKITSNHRGKFAEIKDKKNGTSGFLVWIDIPENYYTMVHECLHLVRASFGYHNIPFNSENEEIIAYYQNYWVRKFWNKMCKFIEDKNGCA